MIFGFKLLEIMYRSTSTQWILDSDVVGLYLSGKDSASNPSGMTQLPSEYIEIDLCHFKRIRSRIFSAQIQSYDIRIQDPLR